ncbi:MAG: hypothetical protein WD757_03970 [Actinomycetota bacterium]
MKRFGIALVLATALGMWAAAPAMAQYGEDPTAGVGDSNPSPGETTTVFGANWCPGSTVDILFDGHKIGTGQVDSEGNFSEPVTIPANASPGHHTITVVGLDFACENVRSVNIGIFVSGGAGAGGAGLAFTGANISVGAVILAALVIVGLAAITAGRRRKATAEK